MALFFGVTTRFDPNGSRFGPVWDQTELMCWGVSRQSAQSGGGVGGGGKLPPSTWSSTPDQRVGGFVMSFGIDFGSILGAFWHYFQCFSRSIFKLFFDYLFNGKWLPKGFHFSLMRRAFFAPFRELLRRRSFEGPLAHFWLTFGSLLVPLGSLLAHFWRLSAPFWLPLTPFGSLLAPFSRRLRELS